VKFLQQPEICTSYYGSSVWFRLRRAIVTYERDTSALRVPVGDNGLDRSRSWTILQASSQPSGARRHPGWNNVVPSKREVPVGAQSQDSSTVSAVSRRAQLLRTATCPQRHRRSCPTRSVELSILLKVLKKTLLVRYSHKAWFVAVQYVTVTNKAEAAAKTIYKMST